MAHRRQGLAMSHAASADGMVPLGAGSRSYSAARACGGRPRKAPDRPAPARRRPSSEARRSPGTCFGAVADNNEWAAAWPPTLVSADFYSGALARVANVELTGAQSLIGDVGCEEVGQGKGRPQ